MEASVGGGIRIQLAVVSSGRESSSRRLQRFAWRDLIVLLLAASWLFPLNFVRLDGGLRLAYLGILVVGLIGAVIIAFSSILAFYVVAWLVAAISFSVIQGGGLQNGLLLIAQVGTGLTVAMLARSPRVVAWGLLVVTSLSLAVDWVVGKHVYASMLGTGYFHRTDASLARAQGIIGQPVPAAFLTLCLIVALWDRPANRTMGVIQRGALLTAGLVSVLATQTRSALLVAAALVVGLLLRATISSVMSGGRLREAAGWCFAAFAAGAGAYLFSSQDRLFDFADLESSSSFTVRAGGLSAIGRVWDNCLQCVLVGHGQGSLQARLTGAVSVDKVRTVDNVYLTVFWDLGLIGLLALAAAVALAVGRLFSRRSVGAARALLVLSIAGLFYDTVFLSTGAILLGLLLGWMEREAAITSYRTRSSNAVHSSSYA